MKLDCRKITILDMRFWAKFRYASGETVLDTHNISRLCFHYMESETWLANRKAGTGGAKSLAKAVLCWMLEVELIRPDETAWLGGKPWRVTVGLLDTWLAQESEVAEVMAGVIEALCADIRESRAELRRWVLENRP